MLRPGPERRGDGQGLVERRAEGCQVRPLSIMGPSAVGTALVIPPCTRYEVQVQSAVGLTDLTLTMPLFSDTCFNAYS